MWYASSCWSVVSICLLWMNFGEYVCQLLCCLDILDLNHWILIDAVIKPIQIDTMCAWHVTNCKTFAFVHLFYYRFVIYKDVKCCSHAEHRTFASTLLMSPMDHDALVHVFDNWARSHLQLAGATCLWLCPTSSTRNPASSDIVSASVMLWHTAVCSLQAHEIGTNVCDRNMHTTWRWLWVRQISCKVGRLGIISVCNLLLDSQRDNTVCSWMCDECNWWDAPVANRTLGSTLWLILPNNSLSKVHLAFPCLQDTSISMQCESKSLTTHSTTSSISSNLIWWSSRRRSFCEVGQPSCAPIRKSVQHTFEHDLPCRSSMLWCLWDSSPHFRHLYLCWSASRTMSVFQSQLCYWLVLLAEYIRDIPDQVMMLGLSNRFVFASLPNSSGCFYFKNNFISRVEKENALTSGDFFPSFKKKFLEFSLPESSRWMNEKIALQWYNWIVNSVPMLWSSCSRQSDPNLWTSVFRESFGYVFHCDLCVRSSLACSEQSGNLQITFRTFAGVIYDAEAACSVNTA